MQKFILCEEDDDMNVDLFNKMCDNLHIDFLIYEVSEEDQMSQFGFLDKVKLWNRGLYQTCLAIPLKVFGVVAAVNRARIWGRELYQIYMNNLMLAETLLVAAIMLAHRDSLNNHSSPSLETCLRFRKCAYPSLIVHSPKRPRRTQGELMDAANPPICQHYLYNMSY